MTILENLNAVIPGMKLRYIGTLSLGDPIVTAISKAELGSLVWEVHCEYTLTSGTRIAGKLWCCNLEFIEEKPEPTICTCSTVDMCAYGCKCGQMERERASKNESNLCLSNKRLW